MDGHRGSGFRPSRWEGLGGFGVDAWRVGGGREERGWLLQTESGKREAEDGFFSRWAVV